MKKLLARTGKGAIMKESQQRLLVENELTEFLNPSYRSRTLKRGFRGAFVVTSKVNTRLLSLGAFCFHPNTIKRSSTGASAPGPSRKITPSGLPNMGRVVTRHSRFGVDLYEANKRGLLIDSDKTRSPEGFLRAMATAPNSVKCCQLIKTRHKSPV